MKLLRSTRLDLLLAVYIFGVVTVNLMGAKVMPLGRFLGMEFNISVAIFLMPVLFTIVDSVSEVYGKKRARNMVYIGIFTIFLSVLFSMLATALPAAERFAAAEAYNTVFVISIRFGIASILAFGLSSLLTVFVYNKMKVKHGAGRLVWLRNNVSNFLSQFTDSTIFVFLAFYTFDRGLADNVVWLFGIILPLTLAKCLMSVITTPTVYAGIRFLRGKKLIPDASAKMEVGVKAGSVQLFNEMA
ncbi:queuosine precursor transporter [Candidatus Saccharibacteria bacterium]|nr:queuosine precursor transporter [Candidatus Saccharibacteria bacterium]